MLFKSVALLAFPLLAFSWTHTVVVGGTAGLLFSPQQIEAKINDSIIFEFSFKNHSVVQSTFDEPCVALNQTGLDSGFVPVAINATQIPTWNVTVETDTPLWFFCKQPIGNHCSKGMVFAVNAPKKGNTFEEFLSRAEASGNTTINTASLQPSGSGVEGATAFSTSTLSRWSTSSTSTSASHGGSTNGTTRASSTSTFTSSHSTSSSTSSAAHNSTTTSLSTVTPTTTSFVSLSSVAPPPTSYSNLSSVNPPTTSFSPPPTPTDTTVASSASNQSGGSGKRRLFKL
ncbi:hypothetical protein BT69DRAFT_1356813 [Atractiella rhizophila]|nr:hypothetical protein BT69DRAFT_1356813 [Atractiella rhizophila]